MLFEKKSLISKILKIAHKSGEGHLPSSLSILDILWVLYDQILKVDPKNFLDEKRDRFILSKGHASLGLYAILAEKGFFCNNDLNEFGKFQSFLGGHPDRNKVPGVEASTGSLGHGFPMAVGVALGLKIKGQKSRVFVLVGDGEANEGTIWESALLASHHQLNNLYCIVDYNHSNDRALKLDDLAKKFGSFNWKVRVVDGHSHNELFEVLNQPAGSRPVAIIAHTIKGNGVKSMENNPAWHHRMPTDEEINQLLKELE